MKRSLTVNQGIFKDKVQDEAREEEDAQKLDEVERQEEIRRKQGDQSNAHWDQVQDKPEEGAEDEENKPEVVRQVEHQRLPRVKKPVGDVLEELMKHEIGEQNVDTLHTVSIKDIEKNITDCLSRVRVN